MSKILILFFLIFVDSSTEGLVNMITIPAKDIIINETKTIHIDEFKIDKFEVTVEEYTKCVTDQKCTEPTKEGKCNYGKTGKEQHPINCISFEQAKAYCEYLGKKLPTELQWETAAKGTEERLYSWGNDEPTKNHANWNSKETVKIGSYEAGKSFYGVYDLTGNVYEFTTDENNTVVAKGGGWNIKQGNLLKLSEKAIFSIDSKYANLGFRCIK